MPILKNSKLLAAGIAATALLLPAAAQAGWPKLDRAPTAPAPVARATSYAEVTQLPDFTGIWYPDWSRLFADRAAAQPQLTPSAQADYDAYQAKIAVGGPDQ